MRVLDNIGVTPVLVLFSFFFAGFSYASSLYAPLETKVSLSEIKHFLEEQEEIKGPALASEKIQNEGIFKEIKANYIYTHFLYVNGVAIYKVNYSIGPLFNRNNSFIINSKTKKKHLIVSGGSNTFSQWMLDEDTLDNQLAKALYDYNVYNFSMLGGSASNILRIFEEGGINNYVYGDDGYFIYNFYDFHISRMNCLPNTMAWSKGLLPYYVGDGEKVEYKGVCIDGLKNKIFYNIANFLSPYFLKFYEFLKLAPKPYHEPIRQQHIDLSLKIIKELKRIYLSHFPRGKFILFLNPFGMYMSQEKIDYLLSEAKKNNILVYWNPDMKRNHLNRKYMLPIDEHMNRLGHKLIANEMLLGMKYFK